MENSQAGLALLRRAQANPPVAKAGDDFELATQRGHVPLQSGEAVIRTAFNSRYFRLGLLERFRQLFLSLAGGLTEFLEVHFEQFVLYSAVDLFQLTRREPPRPNVAPRLGLHFVCSSFARSARYSAQIRSARGTYVW